MHWTSGQVRFCHFTCAIYVEFRAGLQARACYVLNVSKLSKCHYNIYLSTHGSLQGEIKMQLSVSNHIQTLVVSLEVLLTNRSFATR